MENELEINSKKIQDFYSKLTKAERVYLENLKIIIEKINNLVPHYSSIDSFCNSMGIKANEYEGFIIGKFDYTLLHLSKIKAETIRIEIKKKINNEK